MGAKLFSSVYNTIQERGYGGQENIAEFNG
jgi:hypothetical protein